jgi:glycosyltransferase involved in cell wall biosynthesis
VIHVMMATPSNNRYALAGGTLAGRALVVTLHLWTPITSKVQRGLLRAAYGRAATVIAVSDQIAGALHRDLGVSRARLRVVPGGVEDAPPVTPAPRTAPRIGALGRARLQKGFDVLIEATRLLVGEGRDLEVVIGGDGPELAALERRAENLPVRFDGFVQDVPGFLASVDAFCLPSRFEGVPLALLEAMIRGLPCVATSVGGIPEALNGAGILVPPEDPTELAAALGHLMDSPGERAALGERARRRAMERFTVEAMAAGTAAVYREALAR